MTPTKPSVLFVCVKNGGKSQMAAGLMRSIAGESVDVDSAGTKPGDAVNPLSAAALLEVGVDITGEVPKAITAEMVRDADVVITLGRDATLQEVAGTRFENWDTARHRRHAADAPGPRRHRHAGPGTRGRTRRR